MIIQPMGGGLGNQIILYAFGRFLECRNPKQTLLFDDASFFLHRLHNGFELENVFGIHLNLLSQNFSKAEWRKILQLMDKGNSLPRIFFKAGLPVAVLGNNTFPICIETRTDEYSLENWNVPFKYSNIYCAFNWYWWINRYSFKQVWEENLAELKFPKLSDAKNQRYEKQIRDVFSIGIHIRRGDFVGLGCCVPLSNYRPACQNALKKFPDACFFVFSDDPNWCKAHASEMGLDLARQTVYIVGNIKGKNYIDMQLMSKCYGLIYPRRSTFSGVAAWLNQDLKFEIQLEDSIIAQTEARYRKLLDG